MSRKLILHSTFAGPFQREYKSLVNKVVLASLVDDKVVFNPTKDTAKPRIGERQVAWVRVFDSSNKYEDFLAENVIFMESKSGIVIQALGEASIVDSEFIANDILELEKNDPDLKKVSNDQLMFEYRKKLASSIKKTTKKLFKERVNLNANQFDYEWERRQLLKDYVLSSIIKSLTDQENKEVKNKIIIRRNK